MINEVRALIWREHILTKRVEFIAFKSQQINPSRNRPKGHELVELPGGTNSDHPGENAWATVAREVQEEISLSFVPSSAERLVEEEPEEGVIRHAFLIPYGMCSGILRVGGPIRDGSKLLFAPKFMTIEELCTSPIFSRTQRGILLLGLWKIGLLKGL